MAERGRAGGRERDVPGSGHAAGRGDLAAAGQRLPALCAGRVVRAGGASRVCEGRAFLIRYADDFVMGFACEEDARRVLDVLPKRFGKYGLTLHPDKTRLVPFRRHHRHGTGRLGTGRPGQGPSTCWGSPTTGAGRGEGTGW